jgi:hypothetical protein
MGQWTSGGSRTRRKRSFWSGSLAPLIGLAVFGTMIYFVERRTAEETAEWLRREEVARNERAALLAAGDFAAAYERCRGEWDPTIGLYTRAAALAFTRQSLTMYVHSGVDGSSWLQMLCDADGARRGARVERPLLALVPAEAGGGEDEAAADPTAALLVVEAEWSAVPLENDELAREALVDPRTGRAIVRRWRGLEGGARPEVLPGDAPAFGWLVPAPTFSLAAGLTAPTPLREFPRYRFAEDPARAFALVAAALPENAGISALELADEGIEVTIEARIPGFEGDPPARWGELHWDAFGVADHDWWYPRETPGFGCAVGRPLAVLERELAAARASFGPGPVARAWYRCGHDEAAGDQGSWLLTPR